MADPLSVSLSLSGAGLRVQAERMRIVSENIANSQSTADVAGGTAFRRKLMVLEARPMAGGEFETVQVARIMRDMSPFRLEHDPAHPAADAGGVVAYPNVNPLIELADMREAVRLHEANLQTLKQARAMIQTTIDLLRQP